MAGLSGFGDLQLLSNSTVHQVFRTTRQSDGAAVIVKVLDTLQCRDEDGARLRHEYQLLKDLNQTLLVKALGYEIRDHVEILVLQDDGATDLANSLNQHKFDLPVCLGLMIALVRAIGQAHQCGIVHRDVTPANLILIDSEQGALSLKLIDFGLAVQRKGVLGDLGQIDALVGSLRYMAPEQTGKMNRKMDARADFYSMGVTFYEMLVGRTPFENIDEHELIHAHIAKRPIPPHDIDKSIPPQLSNIVMKLLSKNPESRYLSAPGIERDLERCQSDLGSGLLEVAAWQLGQQDVSPQMVIPEQLYGRDQELRQLFRAFSKVRQGNKTMLLLGGDPGAGKTSLVKELYKPVLDNHAYLVFGKYDQLKRDVPYSGLILALRQWIQQLLAESEDSLHYWKSTLCKALGSNGAMLTDLVPELEQIIGAQAPLKKMDPIQHQMLFNHVFETFIAAIARKQHSLVLVLDDLQWADSASLALLETIMTSEEVSNLLLVVIFRNNEVDAHHPLSVCVDAIRGRGCSTDQIKLKPLQYESLQQLVLDTFHVGSSASDQLATILMSKTKGNPFFVEEFLNNLVADGLIRFDYKEGRWIIDFDKCSARNETRNVLEFIAGRLQLCPPQYLFVLQVAACEGIEFKIQTLLNLDGIHHTQIVGALVYGVDNQLVKPVGEAYLFNQFIDNPKWIEKNRPRYRFIHDHILSTVYASCLPDVRREVHHLLGQLLLKQTDLDKQTDRIFSIVRHLNYAVDLVANQQERVSLIRLNKIAAEKALASTAFENAAQYLQTARHLFTEDMWQDAYEFSRELWLMMMEVFYLTEDYDGLEQNLLEFERVQRDRADAMPFYHIKMHALHRQDRVREAIALGMDKLPYVNERLPRNPGQLKVLWELIRTKLYLWVKLRGQPIHQHLKQGLLERAQGEALQSANHLYEIGVYAFLAQRNLFSCLIFRGVRVYLRDGATLASSGSYAAYGVVHCSLLNQVEKGYEYGNFALQLAEAFGHDTAIISSKQVFNGFIRHWKEPLRESLQPLLWVHRRSMEVAELEYVAHSANLYVAHEFYAGVDLDEVRRDAEKYYRVLSRIGLKNLSLYTALFQQFMLNLMGQSNDPFQLEGKLYNPDAQKIKEIEQSDPTLLFYFHLCALQLGVTLDRDEGLDQHVTEILRLQLGSAGSYAICIFYTLHGVLCTRRYLNGSLSRSDAIAILLRYQRKMTLWSRHCPDNFEDKSMLLLGCIELVNGHYLKALGSFEKAVALAKVQGFKQEQALACEMCSVAAMKANLDLAAASYVQQAAVVYQVWGAKAKLALLKETPLPGQRNLNVASGVASRSLSMADRDLDLAALRLALRSISEEKVHTRLIEKTILAASQFAAAQKAILLLKRDEALLIEATITSDKPAPTIMQSITLGQDSTLLSDAVANYVARTRKSVVINDAQQLQDQLPSLHKMPYILLNRVRSIMVIPLVEGDHHQGQLIGMLYLENNLAPSAFTEGMIEALEIIGLSAAGRLELSRKAVTDGLTGLFNHDYFQQQLREQIGQAKRRNHRLCLLLMDIDHFKQFNDTWGHQAGDSVLKEVALLLQKHSRQADVVARYGGEEMALILPDTHEAGALQLAEKIRAVVEQAAVHYAGQELKVTMSVGVSCLTPDCDQPEQLIKAADDALYACKDAGRNQVIAASALSRR
ncbi:MAG: diguanylate cyclase [Ketobacter sp.]|nr:diguanylate cyclase [Ketobacter sp.]